MLKEVFNIGREDVPVFPEGRADGGRCAAIPGNERRSREAVKNRFSQGEICEDLRHRRMRTWSAFSIGVSEIKMR